MTVREQAIQILLLEANWNSYHEVIVGMSGKAIKLANDVWDVVYDTLLFETHFPSCREISLEAAQLLEEGWVPGQEVVRL